MTSPTPDAMVEELEGAARDLRACANKKKDAVESLTGFSLDAIAIYTGNAADLIQQQRATIERLSAALECLCFAVHGLIVATDGCEELRDKRQAALDAMKNAVAALGKDAK